MPHKAAVLFLAALAVSQASQAFENSRGRGSNVTLLVYDEADALHSLYLAQASYCVTTEWSCPTCVDGVTLTRVIEINQERALVGYDSNTNSLFVAYRGTENPRNWLQNVRFLKTAPYSDLPEVKVEKGFYSWYGDLKGAVNDALRLAAAQFVVAGAVAVTGHSAGGAVASLHAFDLARGAVANLTLGQVITFGSPRVGNQAFHDAFDAAVQPAATKEWRVTHYRDAVPHVPQHALGFVHVSTEVYYDEPSTTYKVCEGSGEDKSCSDQCSPFHCTSFDDHLDYLNTPLGSTVCGR